MQHSGGGLVIALHGPLLEWGAIATDDSAESIRDGNGCVKSANTISTAAKRKIKRTRERGLG